MVSRNRAAVQEPEVLEVILKGIEPGPSTPEYRALRLLTNRGTVSCRYYPVTKPMSAVIWVGGVGGDWDTPAQGLYPRLCESLRHKAIASLRVQFRQPGILEESVLDVLVGASYLKGEGVIRLGLVGHSFGGAVVIQAAAACQAVRTVVTLATQSYGAEAVEELGPRCSVLLLHGTADRILPARCTEAVYRMARDPKALRLFEDAEHGLDEVADRVETLISDWLVNQLQRPARSAPHPADSAM